MSLRLAGIDHLSPTAASTLIECERRYWWRYARKLGRNERTEALAMGDGLAHALEHGDLAAGIRRYHEARPQFETLTDPVVFEREAWIAEATIREAYNGYVTRYPAPAGFEREVTYLCSLPGVERKALVRVDGVMAGQYLVEDKLRSGSSMREDAIENERLQGDQLTAEIYVHWRATGDLLPVKFRCTKKIDPRKVKKLETRAEVDEVMAEHFAGDVFKEWDVERTVAQLEQFEVEFADLAQDASLVLSAEGPGPVGNRNTKACHMFGRTCPALPHCQGHVTERELLDMHGLTPAIDGHQAALDAVEKTSERPEP